MRLDHEVRIHGRGGQGVQTVGLLIAQACFAQGRFAQTFATYGGERRGAPITAFVRVAEGAVHRRCDVTQPHAVLLFEPSFLEDGSGLAGLAPGATLVLNTARPLADFTRYNQYRLATLDALAIARTHGLGRILNTAMLGAYCRATGQISLEAMEAVVREHAPQRTDQNLAALREAYAKVEISGEVGASA